MRLLDAELLHQKHEAQRGGFGLLFVVGDAAVSALGVFKIEDGVFLLDHTRGHFTGVSGVNAVVEGGGHKEDFGILNIRIHALVGRIGQNIFALGRHVGVSVFGHPRGSGEEGVVAHHIEKGDLADDRAK
jgi:hypothetical protein